MISSSSPRLSELEHLLPAEKLPVTAIAQMPFPLSMLAMRRYYCADWHKPEPDGETPGKWTVTIRYSYSASETDYIDVEAVTQEEAERLAEAEFDHHHRWDDVDVQEVEAELQELRQ